MKRKIIVIGAGGHAKVAIDSLLGMGEDIACCVGAADSPTNCLGIEVVSGDDNLARLRHEGYEMAFVAIGSNVRRSEIAEEIAAIGFHLVNAISPHAYISGAARVGSGVAIMAGAVINPDTLIDDLAIVNTGATIDHDCRIGRAAHIAPQCALAGNVTVGALAFLGIGTVVIPGITIGDGAVTGAGAVIVSDVPAGAKIAGVPGRQMKI